MSVHGFRMSPEQRRLWQRDAHRAPRAAQMLLRVDGERDRASLVEALTAVVNRHQALRTVFRRRPGTKWPLQVVLPHVAITTGGLDDVGPDRPERAALVERALAVQRERWLRDEPWEAIDMLLVPAEGYTLVGVSVNALSADERSMLILANEFEDALRCGRVVQDVTQYVQFSEWRNDILEDDEALEGRNVWTALRQPPPAVLPFGGRHADPGAPSDVDVVALELDAAMLRQLQARAASSSLESVFCACWGIVLGRAAGAEEIPIGYTGHGRKFTELADSVGVLAGTVPVVVGVAGSPRVAEVVGRVERSIQEALEWEEYFSDPQGAWADRYVAQFAYVDMGSNPGAGVHVERLLVRRDTCRLKLLVLARGTSVVLEVHYERSAVGRENALRLLAQMRDVSAQIARSDADVLVTAVLASSAAPDAATPTECPAAALATGPLLLELIDAVVTRQPDAIAVLHESAHLSFACVAAASDGLAGRLRAIGVGRENRVALWMDRSADTIVALMAVLKAGAAYVPVDPEWPDARVSAQLRGVGVSAVVASPAFAARASEVAGVPVLVTAPGLHSLSPARALEPVLPGQLAYVLFTSGSTGEPKAVGVEHRQLAHYVQAITRRLPSLVGARSAHVSSLAADLGHTVLFPVLATGGCVCVMPTERLTDADAFAEYMVTRAVECLKIVPAHLRHLTSAARPADVLPSRLLVLGGEATSWRFIDRLHGLSAACQVVNHYGPTETTVGAAASDLPRADGTGAGSPTPPLGFALPQVHLAVVDADQRPVPTWQPGELLIGGDGVARGYLSDPARTAARFVPDALSGRAGARAYRTGDCVRRHADGSLEFLGRFDRQIKIRGFRIDPAEVEAVLRAQAAVRDAVVVPEARGDDLRLCAYVVAAHPGGVDERQLRAAIEARLPAAMMPATFVSLDAMPLTTNGKIDAGKLSSHAAERRRNASLVGPRNLGEELLAAIWRDVLGVPHVGVHDDFFTLGGDSLIGTQLVSRVRRTFDVPLPVRSLFEAPTIARLSAAIESMRDEPAPAMPDLVADRGGGDEEPSFGQELLWVLHRLDPRSAAYNSNVPLRVSGRISEHAIRQVLREVVRRHDVLRTAFIEALGRSIPQTFDDARLPVRTVDLRGLPAAARERELQRLAAAGGDRPFDLSQRPLLRATWVRLGDEEQALLVVVHHIAWDGWSLGVFVGEVEALYAAFQHGAPSPLAELRVQYGDYARWQRRNLSGAVADRAIGYWKGRLHGAPEETTLRGDRRRPVVPSFGGDLVTHLSTPESLAAMKALGRREGATLFMTGLAALYVLVHRLTGQSDLVIGTDVANRVPVETEPLIGFFVNNIPLRVTLDKGATFSEVLARTRDAALGGFTYQQLPFARLVQAVQPRRLRSRMPLFQLLFVLQNVPVTDPVHGRVSVIDVPLKTAKFDVALFMSESAAGLHASWTYSTDLFDRSSIERVASQYARLVDALVASPTAPIGLHSLDVDAQQGALYGAQWT